MTPPVDPTFVVIEVVLEEPVQPVGNVQEYDVAPGTEEMKYVSTVPWHGVELPEIVPG
jgi:hypothetical protein